MCIDQSLLQYSQAVNNLRVVMASVQLQKPVEIPQAQATSHPLPAVHTHSKPSEQQTSIQTSQKCEEKHVGSNIVEGVKELLHIEQSSKKTEHVEHQSLSQSHVTHVEKPSTCAKEGGISVIVAEKKKKDKKDKDKKDKDKHAKNNENGLVNMICKSPKSQDKKEKKKDKNKNKDDNSSSSSDDDARSKAKKLDKEKKKHK